MSQTTVKAAVFRPNIAAAQMETLTGRRTPRRRSPGQTRGRGRSAIPISFAATASCPCPAQSCLATRAPAGWSEVGPAVKSMKPGDRWYMTFLACGQCINCKQGIPSGCHQFGGCNMTGRRLDGSTALSGSQGEVSGHFFCQSSFATYSVAKEASVVKVRADAPLEILGPLGCGIQTGAGSVFNVLQPKAGESIAIFGAGGVGFSGLMAAVVAGCNPIILVEPRADRRALAKRTRRNPHNRSGRSGGKVVDQLMAITGFGVQHAFDSSGHPDALAAAVAALAPRGRLALCHCIGWMRY